MNLGKWLGGGTGDDATLRPWMITGLLIGSISVVDWRVRHNVSLGALYVLPILLAARFLGPWQMVTLAALCSILRETFAPFAWQPRASIRLLTVFAAYAAVGWTMGELYRARRLAALSLAEREMEIDRRRAAEAELKAIIETSPLAVLALDEHGRILLANRSADALLAGGSDGLVGQPASAYVPSAAQAVESNGHLNVRGRIECRAQRADGEPFLAHVWTGVYQAGGLRRTALVIWDGSDDLREREDAGFDSLMATSRVLLGAVAHELRNFVAAARNSYSRLAAEPGLGSSSHFDALGRALDGLNAAAASGLHRAAERPASVADLSAVLDEIRVIMEPGFRETGIEVDWGASEGLPAVHGDPQGLVQIMINLLRNSRSALENAPAKRVRISAAIEGERVAIRVADSGPGVANPSALFRVFQEGAQTGLGLYLSRSVARGFGGDLRYERRGEISEFILQLLPAPEVAG